jgi:thioredoxin-like negative regulator of GroEL
LAFYQLAQVYKTLGEEDKYLQNLKTAINLYPRFKAALLEIANYHLAKGDFKGAEPYFVQYLTYYPNDWAVTLRYAELLIEHDRFKEARALLKGVVNNSHDPKVVSAAYKLINKLLLKEAQRKVELQNNS